MQAFGKVLPNGRNAFAMSANDIYFATYGRFPIQEPKPSWNGKRIAKGIRVCLTRRV